MKYADEMLEKVMTEVDVNKDGKIQYEGTYATLALRFENMVICWHTN